MNRRRIAALLRELADEIEQVDEEDLVRHPPAPPRRTVRRPTPDREVDDIARARARKLLQRSGVAPR